MNPYLTQQADALRAQSRQSLGQSVLPMVRSQAQAAGGYGGTRQGIAEGIAMGNAQTGVDSAIAGLYGQSWEADQNRQAQQSMQQAQIAAQQRMAEMQNQTQMALGMGNLGLGFYNAGNNYNLGLGGLGIQQQNANTNSLSTGANILSTAAQLPMTLAGQMQNLGIGQQQANWAPFQNYANTLSQFSGLGGSQQTTNGGSTAANMLGGALGGAQLWKTLFGG